MELYYVPLSTFWSVMLGSHNDVHYSRRPVIKSLPEPSFNSSRIKSLKTNDFPDSKYIKVLPHQTPLPPIPPYLTPPSSPSSCHEHIHQQVFQDSSASKFITGNRDDYKICYPYFEYSGENFDFIYDDSFSRYVSKKLLPVHAWYCLNKTLKPKDALNQTINLALRTVPPTLLTKSLASPREGIMPSSVLSFIEQLGKNVFDKVFENSWNTKYYQKFNPIYKSLNPNRTYNLHRKWDAKSLENLMIVPKSLEEEEDLFSKNTKNRKRRHTEDLYEMSKKSILGSKPASHTYEEGSHSTKNLTDKERKDAWEGGKIDYLGADAFENIQKHIESQVQNINMNAYKASGKNDKNNSHVILTGYNDNNTIKNYQVKGEGLVRKGKENLGRGRLNGVAHPVNNFPPSHSFYSTDSLSDTTQPTMKNLKNSSDLENKYNNYDVYINNTSPTLTQKHLLPVNKLFITHNDSDEKAINNNNEGIHDNVNFKNISSLIFFKITPIFKNVGLKKIPILDARNNQMNILSSNEINDKNDHYIKFYDAYYPNNNGAKPDDPKMNKYTSTTKIISESGNDILDNIQIIQPDCTKHIKPTDCNVSSIHPKFSNIKVTSFGYDDHPESVTTYQVPLRPNAILNHEYNIKDDRTLLTDEKEGKSYKEYTSPHYNYESLIERQKLYETDVRRERETHKTMSQIELEKRSERDKLTVVTLSVTIRDKQGQPVTTKTISLDPIPCQPPPSIASFITNPHIISDKSYVRTRYTTLQPNVNISGRSEYRSIVELPQSSRQIKLQTETFPLSLPKIPDDHHQ
ncbi:putative uncharacterized protein DDB_G0282499 isoform X1 [Gordionus sp. m RMFG-2023]|uniref:putative uncharacterized protein DDB_G0282499 isoform X1 n=1 Tax=Gordionus sp. m RMFG-2023 TaxID=3053472 RepID=UPI0031FDA29A